MSWHIDFKYLIGLAGSTQRDTGAIGTVLFYRGDYCRRDCGFIVLVNGFIVLKRTDSFEKDFGINTYPPTVLRDQDFLFLL